MLSHHITLETAIASVTRARKSEREIISRGKRQRAFVRGGEGAALIKILFLSINPFLMCVYALCSAVAFLFHISTIPMSVSCIM